MATASYKALKCGHQIPTLNLICHLESGNKYCPRCGKNMFYGNGNGDNNNTNLECFLIDEEIFFGTQRFMDNENGLPVMITVLDNDDEIGWWKTKDTYNSIKYVYPGKTGPFKTYYFM